MAGVGHRAHPGGAQRLIHTHITHGLVHAGQPLVTLFDADGKRHVAHAQARMSKSALVVIGAAQPAAQKPKELLPGIGQLIAVGGTQLGVAGLQVHQVVEAVHHAADHGFAPYPFKRGFGVGFLNLHVL